MDGPINGIFTKLSASLNAIPGPRAIERPESVFVIMGQNSSPEGRGIGVESLIQAAEDCVIFYVVLLDSQASFFFGLSDCLPFDHMHFISRISGAPNEFPLGSINEFVNLVGKKDELHDMVGHATKTRFGQGGSASHVEELGLSSSKFEVYIIQKKVEVSKNGLFMKGGKA